MAASIPLIDRLFARIEFSEDHWLLPECANGYTQIKLSRRVNITGHKASYELFIGPIPPGLEIDHLCRVKTCVNPDHLEAVTRQINQHRSDSVSGLNARKTHCNADHEFTEENTYHPPKNPRKRHCIACQKTRDIAYRRKKELRRWH